MMCVKLTIVAAVLLCLAGCSLSTPADLCWTVRSGLPFARQVFIDGQLLPSGTSQDFTINTTSSVLSAQIAKGQRYFVETLNKLPTSNYACTTTSQSNSRWTSVSFSVSAWPYTPRLLTLINTVGLKKDLFCRFYLSCNNKATRTTQPNSSHDSTDDSSDSSDDSAEKATTKASTTGATTTTTATTTTAATTASTTTTTLGPASLFPTVQGTSGGGSFQPGQPVTLQCSFSAISPPTAVTWFLNGVQLIDSNSNTASQGDGSVLTTYTISEVGAPTTGQYTCQGSNANGAGASGPAITVALNSNFQTVLPGNLASKQLDGAVNQQVLLQASEGCEGLSIQFLPDLSGDSAPYDSVTFDGFSIAYPTGEIFPWPSTCNTPNVWIWAQISSSEFSVGTGPVIGQNVAASSTSVSGTPAAYLVVSDLTATSLQTIYLY